MTMVPTKAGPDWASIWADLLRSTGRTLLRLDDSRLANGILVGLDEFEAAQARRRQAADEARRREAERIRELETVGAQPFEEPEPVVDPRQTGERAPHAARLAELPTSDSDHRDYSSLIESLRPPTLPPRAVPRSIHPLEGLWLAPRLPLTPDGRLNLPRFPR